MRLLLIRHGRQSSPLCNVDVELSDVGRRQAELLALRLENLKPDRIYTSGLLRAKQTAEILFGADLPFLEREALNEISFGDMTGEADSRNAVLFPEYFSAKKKKADNLRLPGGECPTEVFDRAVTVVKEAIASGEETVVFVTHGGVIRALVAGLLGLGAEKMLRIADGLEHTSVTELNYSKEAACFSLERLNDASHLEGKPELSRNAWSKG
ncbi:MAG: histidine phosphatase family protein [Lachnospiraceae bacterium]|nr:histidine phosphatase family protein [Lachnospiraceae bacterium]